MQRKFLFLLLLHWEWYDDDDDDDKTQRNQRSDRIRFSLRILCHTIHKYTRIVFDIMLWAKLIFSRDSHPLMLDSFRSNFDYYIHIRHNLNKIMVVAVRIRYFWNKVTFTHTHTSEHPTSDRFSQGRMAWLSFCLSKFYFRIHSFHFRLADCDRNGPHTHHIRRWCSNLHPNGNKTGTGNTVSGFGIFDFLGNETMWRFSHRCVYVRPLFNLK